MDRIDCQCIAEYLTRIVSSTESKTKDIFHQNSLHFFQAMFTHAIVQLFLYLPQQYTVSNGRIQYVYFVRVQFLGKTQLQKWSQLFYSVFIGVGIFGVFSGFGSVVKWFIIMLIELVIQGTNPTEGRHNSAKTLILMFRRMQREKIHCMVATLSRQVYIPLHLTVNHWLIISLVCMSPQN